MTEKYRTCHMIQSQDPRFPKQALGYCVDMKTAVLVLSYILEYVPHPQEVLSKMKISRKQNTLQYFSDVKRCYYKKRK